MNSTAFSCADNANHTTLYWFSLTLYQEDGCTGPEIDISFTGGACLLNDEELLKSGGDLNVECVAPAVTVDIFPAKINSPYKTAAEFTDNVLFFTPKHYQPLLHVSFPVQLNVSTELHWRWLAFSFRIRMLVLRSSASAFI